MAEKIHVNIIKYERFGGRPSVDARDAPLLKFVPDTVCSSVYDTNRCLSVVFPVRLIERCDNDGRIYLQISEKSSVDCNFTNAVKLINCSRLQSRTVRGDDKN